jgi:hypothetical protein
LASIDYDTVLAKLRRADEHGHAFKREYDQITGPENFELIFEADPGDRHVDVYGTFLSEPPFAYLGAIFGDALHAMRSALDHLVWGLSLRHQTEPPPPDPIPRGNRWRQVGFPVVTDARYWADMVRTKLGLVDPALHGQFHDVQPFVVNTVDPQSGWLAMIDALWTADKHRVVRIGNLTIDLERLTFTRQSDGVELPFVWQSSGPQTYFGSTSDAEAYLGRLAVDPRLWPAKPPKVEVYRGFRVNLFMDPGPPGYGKNMHGALTNMHNTAVWIASTFDQQLR